jgi:hypothetical protein
MRSSNIQASALAEQRFHNSKDGTALRQLKNGWTTPLPATHLGTRDGLNCEPTASKHATP